MASRVQVKVDSGVLEGLACENETDSGKKYFSFQGIPYAKPPIGELRFKAPQPVEPWTGVKDATKDGDSCFSRGRGPNAGLQGSEDCLTLNVYTPKLPTGTDYGDQYDLKPVMVFIHGGAFNSGSCGREVFGPQYLLREDVVLVTINYRYGILGFLAFKDRFLDVPGNAAFKDMVLALKWVQANIKNFNGDTNNVTIFGESAGATATHLLMLSPLAKGLFHKVIAQSACGLNGLSLCADVPPLLAKELGIEEDDERKILQKLKSMSVEELFALQEKLPDTFNMYDKRPFGLTIENIDQTGEAFLTENPWKIIEKNNYHPVPLLIGFNSREGMFVVVDAKMRNLELLKDIEDAVPYSLGLKKGSHLSKKIAQKIMEFYFDHQNPNEADIDKSYKIHSDNVFIRDVYRCAVLHSKKQSKPVFLYEMTLETPLNILKGALGVTDPGVCHADDLSYLFKLGHSPIPIEPNSIEDIGIRRFCRLWANFARYSNPNSQEKDPLLPVIWKPFTEEKQSYLEIGEKLSSKMKPAHDRMKFWEEIFRYKNINQL